ncbi:MAG: protein adenylyltransferase SelO family protein, partial [Cyanobacteria bacterium P01_A01_bin.17]
ESFDYGPYAFIETLDLNFTAAYFDYFRRYRYSNQPSMCKWNLEMLQRPLSAVLSEADMAASLDTFDKTYHSTYRQRMLQKLGLDDKRCDSFDASATDQLLTLTLDFLQKTQVGYHTFFAELRHQYSSLWCTDAGHILRESSLITEYSAQLETWRQLYAQLLQGDKPETIQQRLKSHNPRTVITRPTIEAVWDPIAIENNWQPFYKLLASLKNP